MALSSDTKVRKIFLAACERNDLQEIQHTLVLGADVNWRKKDDGWSGLHIAARRNYRELLDLLLAQTGVDVNIRTNHNDTPLMVACHMGHDNIVRRLCLFTGIQMNSRNNSGFTALCYALYQNKPACVSVLILDHSVTDRYGRNVAQLAVESNKANGQRYLELLSGDRRVDWNIKNSAGDTPVMYCLKNNKIEMVRCLIDTPGVDLDTVDRDGRNLEDVARSIFNSLVQSNNVLISQGNEHDGNPGPAVDLQECPAENDPP